MKQTKLGWKVWLVYGILTLLPLVVTTIGVLWFLPEQIPAHYGISGEVDRWGSKYECFILPVLTLPFGGLMLGTAKAASMEAWQGNGTGRRVVILTGILGLVVFNVMDYFFLYTSWAQVEHLGEIPSVGLRIVFLILGILFLALGAMMPLAKRNAWFGIRTKWSFQSETAWKESQRFGGKLFMAAGIVTLLSLLLPQLAMVLVTVAAVLAAGVGSVLYSRRAARKE